MKCIKCNKNLNAHTSMSGKHSPNEGDLTICLYCETLMVYGKDLILRWPTEEEILEFKSDPELWNQIHKAIWIAKEAK